ncbi:MAG: class I SAM-dependent methyltransferase [Chroococcidiopsidaceae cyanobacterium CP_BM_RX_35]|nr:class I SAM-dependent methyltransferase [Chroococcidiopsidaceae cyanobacterium CP_BM_RX_35]
MSGEEAIANGYKLKDFETYFQNERQEMLRYIPQKVHTILEVGCGSGGFAQFLKEKRPLEVWGVELNERAASVAAQRLDRVICGDFNSSLNLPSRSFDCIIFNDVLEHMVDPSAALVFSKELLKTEGVVVASIPNVRYFDNMWNLLVHKDWRYTDYGILDRTHLRFFTRRSILSTFEALGYCVECIEGINLIEKEHPHHSRKFHFLNRLFLNWIEDMRYLQFAVVAHPSL